MTSLLQEFKENLNKLGIKPKKKLGQNFLIDKNILKIITSSSDIKKNDTIIEIGPGMGALTELLVERAKRVICIELDPDMVKILKEKFKNQKNISIIKKDALKTNIEEKKYKIIANIPYYITSPLINHFLNQKNPPTLMTLLIQKEVAEKIVEEKNSILKLMIELNGKPKYIKTVSEGCFLPPPKVKSAIIQIETKTTNKTPQIQQKEILHIAKIAFSNKRKKLSGVLHKNLKIDKTKIQEILKNLNLNPDIRPEKIDTENWIKLNKKLQLLIKS